VAGYGGKIVLAKIDVDQSASLCSEYGVQSIPAVKAFRNGRVVAEFVRRPAARNRRGVAPRLAPSEQDEVLEAARRAIAAERPSEAEQALRQYLAEHPDNPAALLELARVVAMRGAHQDALALLNRIPEGAVEAEDAAASDFCWN